MARKLGEEQLDYHEQVAHNEFAFKEMVKTVRPDIWMLMDLIDETKVNYLVLIKALRHIYNIGTGSKFGTVSVEIQNGIVTFVRGEESDRLNEPAITTPLDKPETVG
jgi:hypothetical protein